MIPASRQSARPTTSVKVKVPAVPKPLILRELGVGAYFTISGNDRVFIKTDETLGRGYRCLDIKTGQLEAIGSDSVITKHYKNVEIDIS